MKRIMAESKPTSPNPPRVCDYCGDSTALLYCRADSAKLCFSCDREVHSTNQLFSKHTRSLLCDACGSSPASIFCETEHSVLCHNCDWERHNLSAPAGAAGEIHSRRPVEGFTGCPSVCELLSIIGLEDADLKALSSGAGGGGDGLVGSGIDGFSDMFIWDTPTFINLDDLIASTGLDHNFQAMGVPPPPKNRHACCGQYKDEMLLQLCELAKTEAMLGSEVTECKPDIQSPAPRKNENMFVDYYTNDVKTSPASGAGTFWWSSDSVKAMDQMFEPSTCFRSWCEESSVVPDKSSEIVHEDDRLRNVDKTKALVLPIELTSQERDCAISRYKEKKRTRRYDKHVRYESRKSRAETRTRIKGRFAKIDQ